jgi:aspartate racemase
MVMSAVPMGLSMAAWEADDHETVGRFLTEGVQQLADAGADFFVCPDNTAHIVLDQIAVDLPLPGLHIADVVCNEIQRRGWRRVGLLGTRWTMTGPVYASALEKRGMSRLIPEEPVRVPLNQAIFEELCQGVFREPTIDLFLQATRGLQESGAECVILGCTEIPLIVTADNCPLPILDSTRLLARAAVEVALTDSRLAIHAGWIRTNP